MKHRVPSQPAFRKVYLKRRLLLLGRERETEDNSENDSEKKDYCGDTRILDVHSDVQEVLGHLNSEELSTL